LLYYISASAIYSLSLHDALPIYILDDLKHLNLGSRKILETPMKNLSGGQRQLLAFIMATAMPPKLFLLDEPTAALDPASATKLRSEEHTSELQSRSDLVCRLLLE